MQMQKVETIAGNAPVARRLTKSGLTGDLLHLDTARPALENVGHGRLHSRRYGKSGSAAILEDAQQGAADAVLSNDVFLREIAITHLCHVAYMNHSAAHHFDRQIVQQIDPWRIDVEINRHFFSADLGRAAWIG